ncbi:MAG: Fe(3+)-transporting ATPase, partial [Frankiales bacterium]|nr:Fe(3+)-transporting ATPase [Frankiales bacterium]
MTDLSLRGVRKAFGPTEVLCGIDLDIPAGSLTAVLGPSGCGKTTLLRLIAGFTEADAGTITFGGLPVVGPGVSVPARRRRVGYVPQEGALFPHLTVAANVLFGLPRDERTPGARLDGLLELVGLDAGVAGRFPHQLSGGQQQRAALARALAPSPAVVLLDEPFSSLDAGLREDTGRAVADALQASGATAVLVTHDQGEALSLADQVAVMRGGRLVQASAPATVYGRPADPGVASFVGGAVLLPGTVLPSGAGSSQVRCALGLLDVHGEVPGEGPDVQVLVRPEQILLGEQGVPARVLDISYFGHDASVRLQLDGSATAVMSRVSGGEVPATGATVALTVRGPVPVFPLPSPAPP